MYSAKFFISLSLCIILFCKCNGQILYGLKNYTEFHPGNFNLLISIPHDGTIKPTNIPDRDSGVTDSNTRKLGFLIRDELEQLFKLENKKPFLVVNNLHRIKLDPNRDTIECCATTDNDGYLAYLDYHNFIKTKYEEEFMQASSEKYKQGLLIDLHGQSHAEEWMEVGYLLSNSELNKPLLTRPDLSSIRLLTATSKYTYEDLIRGTVSVGGMFQTQYNIKSVPSPAHKGPNGSSYFNGGFITRTYGSVDCKSSRINAIQIEVPYYIRDNKNINDYYKLIAKTIYDYYYLHNFDAKLTSGSEASEINSMISKCLNTK